MTGSVFLDICISLISIYLLYSLLATTIVEMISSLLRLRSTQLKKTFKRMLQDKNFDKTVSKSNRLSEQFFEHPSIKYLSPRRSFIRKWSFPSYVANETFSKTIVNILRKGKGQTTSERIAHSLHYTDGFDRVDSATKELMQNYIDTMKDLEERIVEQKKTKITDQTNAEVDDSESELESLIEEFKNTHDKMENILHSQSVEVEIDPETRHQLCTLYRDSHENPEQFKTELEEWYIQTQDRSKGAFKRTIACITFGVGLILAVTFNLDTIEIASELQNNPEMRISMLKNAETMMADFSGVEDSTNIQKVFDDNAKKYQQMMTNINAQMSTTGSFNTNSAKGAKGKKILGFLLTAIALSLGAPFWFDLLNKFMRLRTSLPSNGETTTKKGKEKATAPKARG